MTTGKFMDEVVDDSEPEREELRRKEKDERKEKKRLTKLAKLREEENEIIELTDGESNAGGNIIEISDESLSSNLILPNSKLWTAPLNAHNLSRGSQTRIGVTPSFSSHASSVIELSDNTTPPSILSSLPTESAQPTQPKYSSRDTMNDMISRKSPFLKEGVFSNLMLDDSGILNDSENELEDMGVNLNLARFAYKNSRSSSKPPPPIPGPSRQGPTAGIATEVNPPAKMKSTRGAAHRFTSDFSDADLAKLMKCVSCDVRWTTRKSAAQKMMHVQSCAKKRVFTDETVRVLIRREIDNALVEDVATKGKGKGKGKTASLASEPVLPKTFYEDVINDAAPRKKGKRLDVVETVKSVVETRDVILDRARTVLGIGNAASSTARDEDFSVQTQAFGGSKLGCAFSKRQMPPAQPFRQNAVAQPQMMLKSNSMFPTYSDPEPSELNGSDVDIMPPTTQRFAPSKLGGSFRPPLLEETAQYLPEFPSGPRSPVLSQSNLLNRPATSSKNTTIGLFLRNPDVTPLFDLATSSAREHSQQQRMRTRDEESVDLPSSALPLRSLRTPDLSPEWNWINEDLAAEDDVYGGFTWDNDNACLHFDPDLDNQKYSGPANDMAFGTKDPTLQHHANTKSILKPTQLAQPQRKATNYDTEESDIPFMTSRTPKKKTKRKGKDREVVDPVADPDGELDENWEHRMKAKIIQHQTLHLRILRYEPIHFDVFLKLVTDQPSRGLKTRLRSFLDKQAINFYGAEPTGRRL